MKQRDPVAGPRRRVLLIGLVLAGATLLGRAFQLQVVDGGRWRERAAALDVSLEQTAYVGNDINDAECLRAVGVSVVPADAWPEVKTIARWVLSRSGGHGCVREFCDAVWAARRA